MFQSFGVIRPLLNFVTETNSVPVSLDTLFQADASQRLPGQMIAPVLDGILFNTRALALDNLPGLRAERQIGLVVFQSRPDNIAKIIQLDAHLKRVGVGRQLYFHAERILTGMGVRLIYLQALPSANGFWLRMGFRFVEPANQFNFVPMWKQIF